MSIIFHQNRSQAEIIEPTWFGFVTTEDKYSKFNKRFIFRSPFTRIDSFIDDNLYPVTGDARNVYSIGLRIVRNQWPYDRGPWYKRFIFSFIKVKESADKIHATV